MTDDEEWKLKYAIVREVNYESTAAFVTSIIESIMAEDKEYD